jgi:hypothetical protein
MLHASPVFNQCLLQSIESALTGQNLDGRSALWRTASLMCSSCAQAIQRAA